MSTLYGISPSPFVRKVRVVLAEKGIAYEHEPVPPFPPANATPEFRAMSPLGKIPAYRDGDFAISDSSVICAYLERTHPDPALYPQQARSYARALWFEELADSKLAEALGTVFFQRVVAVKVLKGRSDDAAVQKALDEAIPPLLDYLEGQLGEREYLVDDRFSIADVAVGTQFANFVHAGESVDAGRWPGLAAFVERVHGRPSFKGLLAEESQMLAAM